MAVKSRTAQTRRGFLQLVASGVGSAVLAKTAMAEFRDVDEEDVRPWVMNALESIRPLQSHS